MKRSSTQGLKRSGYGLAVGCTAAGLLAFPVLAPAQETGGLSGRVDLSAGLRFEDRDGGGDKTSLTTQLNFNLSSETRTQTLGLRGGGRFELDDEGDTDFTPQAVVLSYGIANKDTQASGTLSFREQDLSQDVSDEDDFTGAELTAEDGERRDVSAGLSFATGGQGPFRTSTSLSYRTRTFDNVVDPDLFDSETTSLGTTFSFLINPQVTLRATGSFSETEDEDAVNTQRTRVRYGLGADVQVDRLWTAGLDLGFANIETERDDGLGGRDTTEDDSLEFGVSAARAMSNGNLTFNLGRSLSDSGEQTNFRVSRAMELAGGASLQGSFGLTAFDGGETRPVASLSYSQDTRRGAFSVDLQQSAGVNDDDDDVIRTRLSARYSEQITAVSRWSLQGSLQSVNVVDGADPDTLRLSVGPGYSRALTDDWDFDASLTHRVTFEDGDRDSRRNTLSIGLKRSFSFRP